MGVVVPSFPVQNFIPVPYKGDLTAVNVWLLTGGVVTRPMDNGGLQTLSQGHQSKVVNTAFNWATQFSSQAVSINFQNNNNANANLLDKIIMVYINNVDNPSDTTVYFPDSGMFVTCPSGSAGYYPVFTNLWIAYVYNGYTGVGTTETFVPQNTQVIFCNFAVPGFLAQTQTKTTQAASIFDSVLPGSPGTGFEMLANDANYELMTLEAQILYITATAAGPCQVVCTINNVLQPANIVIATFGAAANASAAGVVPCNAPFTRTNWTAAPFPLIPQSTLSCNPITMVNATNALVCASWTYNVD